MVKRRTPKASVQTASPEPTVDQIEAFAAGAEGGSHDKPKILDPDANRNFKTISLPFNEYEYEQLLKGARLTGRTKLNFVRYAMLKLSKELQE